MAPPSSSDPLPLPAAVSPRKEAQSLAPGQLTPQQLTAYERAFALLIGMATEKDQQTERRRDWELGSPTNRVILIDGGRGAGKTTVLLSVLDRIAQQPAFERDSLRVHFFLLPLLDLHPLPRTTSILSHVAARLLPTDAARSPAPWRPSHDAVETVRTRWRAFAQNAALGWDSNVVARSAHLDAEAYAHELERATSSWRNIGRVFSELLDELCDARRKDQQPSPDGRSWRPLFVLPIDDADMNPERSLEAMELFRALSHPRLAFVLTGDSKLFESQLRASYLGRLREPLRHLRLDSADLTATSHRSDAIRLAYEYFERVIPPDQRCQLPGFDAETRADAHEPLRKLLEMLVVVDAADDASRVTLASLLRSNGLLGEALPERLRPLINLQRLIEKDVGPLDDAAPNGRSRAVGGPLLSSLPPRAQSGAATSAPPRPEVAFLWAMRRIWRDAVRHATLGMGGQEMLLRMVRLDYKEHALELVTGALTLSAMYQEVELRAEADELRIELRRPMRLMGAAMGIERPGEPCELPPKIVAAFELAYDVAVLSKRARVIGRSPLPAEHEPGVVRVELPCRNLDTTLSLTWPLPRLSTFSAQHRLIEGTIRRLTEEQRSSANAGRHRPFERDSAARALVFGSLIELGALPPGDRIPLWDELLETVTERMRRAAGEVAEARGGRERAVQSLLADDAIEAWAMTGLVLLAAPESGLPPGQAEHLLAALSSRFSEVPIGAERSLWDEVRALAPEGRARRIDAALKAATRGDVNLLDRLARFSEAARVTEVLKELDDRALARHHPWFKFVQTEVQAAEERKDPNVIAQQMLSRLAATVLPAATPPAAPAVSSLSSYIEWSLVRKGLLRRGAREVEAVIGSATLPLDGDLPREELPFSIANAWRSTLKEGAPPALYEAVHALPTGRLRVRPLARREDEDTRTLPDVQPAGSPEARVIVRTFVMTVRPPDNPNGELPPHLDLFYRVVWDLATDGFINAPRLGDPYITGNLVEIAGSGREGGIPWPTMPFQALLDLEMIDENWTRLADNILRPGPTASSMSPQDRVDALAFFLVELIKQVALRRQAPARSDFKSAPSEAQWRRLIASLYPDLERTSDGAERGFAFGGERRVAFQDWRARVPLLAAPECGLSQTAATAILRGVFDGKKDHEALRAQLRDYRVEHVRRSGRTGPAAWIAKVDAKEWFRDHPWIREVVSKPSEPVKD